MSTNLVKVEPQSLALKDVMTLGDVFKASGYFRDVRDQAQAVVKVLYGQELGFSPVVSMMGIHIIEGKPSISANLMGAMVKRSGKYDYKVVTLNDTDCILSFTENGALLGESKFSMADAQRAGVVKDGSGWKKYPRNMMFARALSNGVKLYCPELSTSPIYVPEELGATVSIDGEVIDLPEDGAKNNGISPTATVKKAFGKPANGSGGASKVEADPDGGQIAGREAHVASGEAGGSVAASDTSSAPADERKPAECIGTGQQRNFHKECRAAVKPARSMEADNLTYQWLKDNGYEKGGEPSAALIPVSAWPAARDNAVAWLRAQ